MHMGTDPAVGQRPHGKFEKGYAFFSQKLRKERIEYFYRCGASGVPLEEVLTLAQ